MLFHKSRILFATGLIGVVLPLLSIGAHANAAQTVCLNTKNTKATVSVSGTQATAKFTIPAKCGSQEVSFVSYKAPSANGDPLTAQTVYKSLTATYSTGAYSLNLDIPDCYFQVDLVQGAVIQQFTTDTTYHKENRWLAGKNGGTQVCTTPNPNPNPNPTPNPTPTPSPTPTSTTLPNTGAGNVLAIGLIAAFVGTVLHFGYRKLTGRV
jgi:hypothetical protein